MSFGTKLKESREEKGYKQNQFADMLGITATRLNYWEKDKREPDVAMIKKISALLDVSSDWLIGNEQNADIDVILSSAEKDHIKKYRSLDEYGKQAVNSILGITFISHYIISNIKTVSKYRIIKPFFGYFKFFLHTLKILKFSLFRGIFGDTN